MNECEYIIYSAGIDVEYNVIMLFVITAFEIDRGDEYDVWSSRGCSVSLFVEFVMKVIEMYVRHVVFNVVSKLVRRPKFRGIVNFKVFAPSTDIVIFRGYPPGKTQALILSLA